MSSRDFPSLGSLSERIELQSKIQTIDAAGGHVQTFDAVATVWARVVSGNGAVTEIADARSARISHTATIRFRSDIGPGDRVIYRSEQLEIISANDLNGRRAYLVLKCSKNQVTG
ncbi:MAG: phage head closure protein [Devosiaceae bacterium]|nr:phage head closure protein [Devosiaceae bacterium]